MTIHNRAIRLAVVLCVLACTACAESSEPTLGSVESALDEQLQARPEPSSTARAVLTPTSSGLPSIVSRAPLGATVPAAMDTRIAGSAGGATSPTPVGGGGITVPDPLTVRDAGATRPGTRADASTPSTPTVSRPELMIVPMALRNATDTWAFAIAGADTLTDVMWDFGDGTTFRGAYAEHSYAHRPQREPTSAFRVAANVNYRHRGATGSALVKFQLVLPNYALFMRERGTALIQTSHHPRFPTRDAKGMVSQTVTLWHGESRSLTIEKVEVTRYYRDGSARKLQQSLRELAGWDVLEPERERTFRVELDTRREPQVTHVSYRLIGKDEKSLHGRFTLMIPVHPKSSEVAFVESAELREQVIRARRVLQKPFVTSAEVAAVALRAD